MPPDLGAVVVEHAPDPRDLAMLEERLAAAAVAAVGAGDEEEFAVFVRDGDDIVAGVSGAAWGGCCQVHVVWVDQGARGRGLARALLAEAEAEARRRGCRVLMGLTYEALTGDFYDRLGYRTLGVLDGYPEGTTTRWYCKDL
jgi:GNAT superfamily N-acetyltransferase